MRALLLVVLVLAPLTALAAFVPTLTPTAEIVASPRYPGPNETVFLSAHAFSGESGISYLWVVNGAVVDQGIGRKTIPVIVGALGSETRVSVLATNEAGEEAEGFLTLRPAEVDLVWEGRTYVPPLYSGRPLSNGNSGVVVVAVPHVVDGGGARAASNDLMYTWNINGNAVKVLSGKGRSTVLIQAELERVVTVSVTVSTEDNLRVAEKSVVVETQTPSAVIYENSPLGGILFNRAVAGTFAFSGDEVSFTAFPVFVTNARGLSYQWALGGKPFVLDEKNPRIATFRKTGEGSGNYPILFSFNDAARLFEHAVQAFSLTF